MRNASSFFFFFSHVYIITDVSDVYYAQTKMRIGMYVYNGERRREIDSSLRSKNFHSAERARSIIVRTFWDREFFYPGAKISIVFARFLRSLLDRDIIHFDRR